MGEQKPRRKSFAAIGLMSGTSMDGIDAALLYTNGKSRIERGPAASYPYKAKFRRKLASALDIAKKIKRRADRPGNLAELEREITLRHAEVVGLFIRENRLRLSDIDLIGFHGQTVIHRPGRGLTVQLGDGRLLAAETGLQVVADLRASDMIGGGQGAPLVPVYHRALARNLPASFSGRWPVAFVNIGGIANITWISAQGGMIAFDTGPGNALIDQWVAAHAGVPYDAGGAIASEGMVLAGLAARYLEAPYFAKSAPKSLDRNDFRPPEPADAELADGARTLAHVTATAIWRAREHLPEPPKLWVLCGGGRKNRVIVDDLRQLALDDGSHVMLAEEAGFDGDSIEAEAWAYLAVRSFRGLNITWPATTGVIRPTTGGVLCEPVRGQKDQASFA